MVNITADCQLSSQCQKGCLSCQFVKQKQSKHNLTSHFATSFQNPYLYQNNFNFVKMRLTLVLFRRNRLPNGNLFRGKDRLVKKVEPFHLRRLQEDFAVEEKNMLYLRYPYLTEVCPK